MAKLTTLKADASKESGGVWVEWEHGVSLLVARLNNTGFQAAIRELTTPHTKEIRSGKISDAKMEELSRKAMATHVLLDWKNIEDDDGAPLEYTPEMAFELLNDPGLRDLYQFVLTTANERELYRLEAEDESRGNSQAVSSGA